MMTPHLKNVFPFFQEFRDAIESTGLTSPAWLGWLDTNESKFCEEYK